MFHQESKESGETKESVSRCQYFECFLHAHPTFYQSKPSMTISSGSITSMDAQTNFGHGNNDFYKQKSHLFLIFSVKNGVHIGLGNRTIIFFHSHHFEGKPIYDAKLVITMKNNHYQWRISVLIHSPRDKGTKVPKFQFPFSPLHRI